MYEHICSGKDVTQANTGGWMLKYCFVQYWVPYSKGKRRAYNDILSTYVWPARAAGECEALKGEGDYNLSGLRLLYALPPTLHTSLTQTSGALP
jgi:hypothetical protein